MLCDGLGKSLGFIVSERGIEANMEKIEAIMNMKPPKNLNNTQRLVGRVAALNRFVSRSTDKCPPSLGSYERYTHGMRSAIKLSNS